MRLNLLLFLLLGGVTAVSISQTTFQISGNVLDNQNQSVAFANILVLESSDSSLVKGAITDENGNYELENLNPGNYYVRCTLLGYQDAASDPFELSSNMSIPTLVMFEGESLGEVVVQAKKPLYAQKVDRLVINVENSIVSSGGTALEVLERSPGVIVNRQNNAISVVGKDGVVVMINGKISYVPASSLVQMLEGMNADNIESIELITTPPANLDAEGNAGYINIILKSNPDMGLNGSYALSAGYGKGVVSNDNINFNYRKNKLNLFGSYSFSLDQREQNWKTSREYMNEGNLLANQSTTNRDPSQRNHNIRLGTDYQLNAKTIMGGIITLYDNRWSMDAFNTSFNTTNGLPTTSVEINTDEINQLKHFGANYNFKYNFQKDEFVSLDVDYLFYEFNNPTDYVNDFFDSTGSFTNSELLRSRKETPLTTWVGKLDYSNKVNDNLSLDFGTKATQNDFENDVSIESLENGSWVFDPTLTNFSVLDEKIIAGYASADYTLNEKISFKGGMRYEYTDSKLDTDTEGRVVDRQYGIWFPSLFIIRKWSDDFSTNLAYSKRITRPTFNDLAPFVIFFEPNTFLSGNASIQPAISNTVKMDFNYKSYFLSFQYTDEDSTIANFQETIDEETGRLVFEADNLDYTRTFSIITGFPLKIADWWRTQNNVTYVRQKVSSFYKDEIVKLELGIFSANSSHSFKITDSFSAELSGFYNGPGFFGNATYDAFYGVNAGLQQNFGEKWGTLKFSVNDLLDSLEFNGGTDLPEQNIRTRNTFDFSNRTFKLTYTRNFGNKDLKSARNRETGAEEERRRVN
jgi:Outer membrane protein beta-barrel family/Carboxypeptidase regulatory-like domain